MINFSTAGRYLFAIPWLVIGVQHFIYSAFLEGLVPEYMPFRIFWVYFTGIGMLAAGMSFILNIRVPLAATCLGVMLMFFILLLHVPIVSADITNSQNWTRALQDISIAAVAFMMTDRKQLMSIGLYFYAIPLIVFGAQHFLNLNFVTAKVPDYLPLKIFWDILLGVGLLSGGIAILSKKYLRIGAMITGSLLLIFFLLQLPGLLMDIKNPIKWIIMMLELSISAGSFILIQKDQLFRAQQHSAPVVVKILRKAL